MTSNRGSGDVCGGEDIHRAPQGMVLPKRARALSRMRTATASSPMSLMRSRDFWRSYQSGDLRSWTIQVGSAPQCQHKAIVGHPVCSQRHFTRRLLHVAFGGVVIEVEAPSEGGGVKLAGHRSKGIGGRNASPSGAVERDVTRGTNDLHARHFAVGQDGEFEGAFARLG